MKHLWLMVLFSFPALADLEMDKAAIKKMAGCYKIVYQNSETFSPEKEYKFYDRFTSYGLEWIFVDEEAERSVSLQHLLIVPGNHVVKHWRQEWRYEDKDLLAFTGDSTWLYFDISQSIYSQKGHWTQATFQVDDSPRYECSAPWVRWGNIEYWECKSNAPLPRREFSVRSDYNILRRNNRHEMTSTGHVHSGEAEKISRVSGKDTLIALEMGKNVYTQVEDSLCQVAQDWWPQHETFWRDVRAVWEEIYAEKRSLSFHGKLEGKVLWEKLFALDEAYFAQNTPYNSAEAKTKIQTEIKQYLK